MRPQRITPPPTAFRNSHGKSRRPRIENGTHLRWIRTLPCLVTGRRDGIEAAHIRYEDHLYGKREIGLGERADDRWAVPLNRDQHLDQHANGEREWWIKQNIDPLPICLALYQVSGDDELGEEILRQARERRQANDGEK